MGRLPEEGVSCGGLRSKERMWGEEFMVRVLRLRLSWLGEKREESCWSGVRRGVRVDRGLRSSSIMEM